MSRSALRRITTGRWLSRVTCARSSSNSGWRPASNAEPRLLVRGLGLLRAGSAIATSRSVSAASKNARVTSSCDLRRGGVRRERRDLAAELGLRLAAP